MLKKIKNQRGVSVLVLIMALTLLSIFALLAVWLLAGHSNITDTFWKSQQAFYIADAGLRVNAQKLQDNWSGWNNASNFPNLSFDGGTISATITDDNDDADQNTDSNGRLILQVTGTLDNVQRTLEAEVTYSVPALDCAIYSTGSIAIQGAASVVGQTIQNAPSLPVLDEAAAIAMAKANTENGYASRTDGNYFQGDFDGNPTSLNGVIYIDTFPDGSPANVTINNADTTDGNPALFIIMGHLHVTAQADFNGLIYNAGTATVDLDLTGNHSITGGIISSHDVFMRGSCEVTYNQAMMRNSLTDALITENPSNYIYEWREIH